MTPYQWPTVRLGDEETATLDRGVSWSKSDESETGTPVVGIPNIKAGVIDYKCKVKLAGPLSKKKLLKPGDILLVGSSGAVKNVGRSAIVREELPSAFAFASFVARVRPGSEFNPHFIAYVLQSALVDFEIHCKKAADGKFNLQIESLREQEVPKPSQQEQEKIAAVLWKVQRAIEIEEKTIESARELKQSAMHQLFTRGVRGEPQKETGLGLSPQSWEPTLVGDFGEVVTGTTPRTAERRFYDGGTFHFIAPGDLGETTQIYTAAKTITEAGLGVSRVLPKHSVCFVCIGSSIGKVGITTQDRSTTNQQINAIIVGERFDPFYVCYLLAYWSGYLSSFASPSPVPIMSKGKFEQVTLYASPDKEEQSEIARMLRVIDNKIEVHRRKRSTLEDLFKTLLHKLMTGELRVADLDIDTSAVVVS